MTEHDDIDALAAEFALGTLDADERTAVMMRRLGDFALDAAIEAWERRLAPLNEDTPPVAPPAGVWARIEGRLNGAHNHIPVHALGTDGVGTNVVALEARVRRWRRLAISASAIAAALLLTLGLRETVLRPAAKIYVASFQKDDSSPVFMLTVDLDKRLVTVRRVAAERPSDKTYQLWIASDRIGAGPRSLGLISSDAPSTQHTLAAYRPDVLETATFGVSLEPLGGSPTGRPTGPALHAKLVELPQP
jgi:anti-sigma-K factor RskA